MRRIISGNRAARHDAVLDVIIGRQRAHGAEGAFSTFPEQLPLRSSSWATSDFASVIALANRWRA